MTARQIVDRLLEAEPLDSLEGVPDFDEFMQQHFSRDPLNPSREWRLRYKKPSSPAEARALGVNWYVKNGRKFTTSMAEPDYGGYPRKSHTLAANRNARARGNATGRCRIATRFTGDEIAKRSSAGLTPRRQSMLRWVAEFNWQIA